MKTFSRGCILAVLAFSAAGCPTGPATRLTVHATGSTSMTVYDIADDQFFVSSGVSICTDGGGTVTVTSVQPSGDHEGLVVTDFDTFVAALRDQSIPLGVRGDLAR